MQVRTVATKFGALAIAVFAMAAFGADAMAGVGGHAYGITASNDDTTFEDCYHFEETERCLIFGSGNMTSTAGLVGTYYEVDFGIIGYFSADTVAGGVTPVTLEGVHVLGVYIFGQGDAVGGIGVFDFEGPEGCTDEEVTAAAARSAAPPNPYAAN